MLPEKLPPLLDTPAPVKAADSGNASAGTEALQGKAGSSIPLGYRKLIFLEFTFTWHSGESSCPHPP